MINISTLLVIFANLSLTILAHGSNLTPARCSFDDEPQLPFSEVRTDDQDDMNRFPKLPVDSWHPIEISECRVHSNLQKST